ncbi:CinA family protein [bacterium]|nr:CinA family protein [bacterium]
MSEKPSDELLFHHAERLLYPLKLKKMTIAFAESVTAGGFMYYLTSVPGASEVFKGGIVAYSNEIKTDVLGVSKETIERYGVVSKEVAIEMAKKVREMMGTTIGVGITGYAGPEGGDEFAPVGQIYIGYVDNDCEDDLELNLKGEREEIRFDIIMKGLGRILRNVVL